MEHRSNIKDPKHLTANSSKFVVEHFGEVLTNLGSENMKDCHRIYHCVMLN